MKFGQRRLHIVCQVCGDKGWMQAAPVYDINSFDGHHQCVGRFAPVPCFACVPARFNILT